MEMIAENDENAGHKVGDVVRIGVDKSRQAQNARVLLNEQISPLLLLFSRWGHRIARSLAASGPLLLQLRFGPREEGFLVCAEADEVK